ncbi:MAG: hypothetical protein R2724_00065 [Bryobacterales bacterium]
MLGHRFAKAPGSALDAHLGYWLRRVSNHVSGVSRKACRTANVSVAEWVALNHIDEHPEFGRTSLRTPWG